MSVPLRDDDPAAWMLRRGMKIAAGQLDDPNWITPKNIHRDGCYICEDPEFALMGLPVCKPCVACQGHVAADDTICDDCGADAYELYLIAKGEL